MPATPLTDKCRAIGARMQQWHNVGGNAQLLLALHTEDERTVYSMRDQLDALRDPGAPDGMVANLDNVCEHMRDAPHQNGVLANLPRMAGDGSEIIAAADYLDSWEPTPPPDPPPESRR